MRLTVIGSSDAFNSSGRGHSCYLIESDGAGRLMIDFGPTALAGVRRAGKVPNDISGIAFTHLHGDHVGGMPFLLIDALYQSARQSPLSILGPVLTRHTIDELMRVTYGDIAADLGRLSLSIDEAEPGESRDICGYRVRCFAADHMKLPHRPLCLRVEDGRGRSLAFSGDTRLCPGLFEAADGADWLIAECTRISHPAGHHITLDEWTTAWGEVRAKGLLLSHLGEDVRARGEQVLSQHTPPIPVKLADDGLVLEIS